MDIKPRPNHRQYIELLRRMSPEQRLLKAFELSDFTRTLFLEGLRSQFANLSEDEFKKLAAERLRKCHNRNY
jgi:hypothetical protein